jgi:ClpP class serine protease
LFLFVCFPIGSISTNIFVQAGDMKNPITQYGEVSKEDIQNTQEDLEEIHESFINLCRLRRPTLDLEVCNGRVLSGDRALEKGMIDRILTSDEYIMEKISEGDLVMKLHLVSGRNEHNMISRALELLPHLSSKFKRFISTSSGGTTGSGINAAAVVGRRNASTSMIQMDGNVANKVVQVVGLACMIQRAIARTGVFDFSKPQF